ncbi:MAG: GyrI-like domain-containing protein [Anaerolineae bacterium]
MAKLDLKKEMKHLYEPSVKEVTVVDVPSMNFLMIDGSGDPNDSAQYQAALEVLYGAAYTIKFMLKKQGTDVDYTVPPLEGLWWAEDMDAFVLDQRAGWLWTMMIMQPAHITAEQVVEGIALAAAKKDAPPMDALRFAPFAEGLSAQIMHVGPYAAEAPTIARLHAYIEDNGYLRAGKHHEIYLGDPRRTQPEKLRTVIRQPIRQR